MNKLLQAQVCAMRSISAEVYMHEISVLSTFLEMHAKEHRCSVGGRSRTVRALQEIFFELEGGVCV